MNNYEKMIPRSFKPISAWGYVGYSILYGLPVIGFIFALVHAIGAHNRNVRSFARSYFAAILLAVVLAAVLVGVYYALVSMNVISEDMYKQLVEQLQDALKTKAA